MFKCTDLESLLAEGVSEMETSGGQMWSWLWKGEGLEDLQFQAQ
jgi:hypothetical protein